ncbi:hypothetical protein HDV57DRAFT_412548 [Trichoderma longibrachiatum]
MPKQKTKMLFDKTCFALVALCLVRSFLSTAAAAPSRESRSPASFSFSASVTTKGAPSSTETAWGSLTDEADISQPTSRTRSSHSCPNVFCLPISPWTKTEAHQTSTSTPSTHPSSSTASSKISASNTSPSACVPVSASKTPSPWRFNFTDACDADTPLAEDCRATLTCETSLGLFPTCDRGRCACLAKECFRKSMCETLRQCRDYDEAVCVRDGDSSVGVCGCRARVTGCLFRESPHTWCGRASNCTERYFSLYPEFPFCSTGEKGMGFPTGKCECRDFGCERTGDEGDFESCRGWIDCEGSPLGRRAICGLKYGDERKGAEDGYCTCGE